jgi:hypothetical protein
MRHPLLILVLLSTAFSANGCADGGASLFITGIGGLDDECLVDTSVSLTNAVVDVALTDNLVVYPVFASQVRDRVSPNAANPSDMHVLWVDVRLQDLGGNTLDLGLPNPFRVPTSVFIEGYTGSGEVPTGTGAVQVLPPGYADAVAAAPGGSVLAALRPIGRTNGGIEVEGNFDFHYQIIGCTGCLSRCAVGDEELVSPCTAGQNDVAIIACP